MLWPFYGRNKGLKPVTHCECSQTTMWLYTAQRFVPYYLNTACQTAICCMKCQIECIIKFLGSLNLNECEWCVYNIHTHMYCTVKQTENTFPEETPAFQEAITLFVLIQRSTACLCLSGRTSALHELHSCVSWQPCGEPSLQRHNSFDCTEFTLWWIAAEFGFSFYLMPVHTYQVSLLRERREEREMANATVHRNSVSILFDNQR